ncbi:MAG: sugar ABC transporter permease [Clostridiales bacterium]|nr:sugar ABC transporter permease [Clostridiales bacterium]
MKKKNISFWLFLFPVLFAFVLVVFIPFIMGIYYSFTDWNGISSSINMVGFQNYINAFKDETFLHSFWFTTKFTIVSVIVLNVIGFLLALLVTQKLKTSNILKTIFFMPNLIGGLILGFIWQFIFQEVFATIGNTIGVESLNGWLSDEKTGFWGLVILMSWQMSGYLMIIYISGIQGISREVLEAAKIDGASPIQRLKHIILPLVRPAMTVSVFLTLSNSFKLYDQNLSLTAGGPGNATQMISMNILKTGQKFNDMGQAQAKAIILLLVVGAISLIQVYISKKGEVEA